jgi:CO/xanthine dehydrogenase Mo-binding subunit
MLVATAAKRWNVDPITCHAENSAVVQTATGKRLDLLRINETPQTEVHIVQSADGPGGIGEPGTPPIVPAECNAISVATGKPVRRLPIRAEDLA